MTEFMKVREERGFASTSVKGLVNRFPTNNRELRKDKVRGKCIRTYPRTLAKPLSYYRLV